ncbi:MAG: hypothetical protein HY690_03530 [Chloroflexi bacterium]|nr:hypothetical protein [Chloroflexota bacterium]
MPRSKRPSMSPPKTNSMPTIAITIVAAPSTRGVGKARAARQARSPGLRTGGPTWPPSGTNGCGASSSVAWPWWKPTTLPQVAGALRRARACVSVDNGIMHLAAAVGVPTLALFGASPWRLWLPRAPHVLPLRPSTPCPCGEPNWFRNDACLQPAQHCMAALRPSTVIRALASALRGDAGTRGRGDTSPLPASPRTRVPVSPRTRVH